MRKLSVYLGLLVLTLTLSGVAVAQSVGTRATTWTIDSEATDTATNALIFGGNSNKIINITDGTFVLDRAATGTVSLSATDDDSTAALIVGPGGAAALQLGTASATSITLVTDGGTVTVDGGISQSSVTLANSESITNGTDGQFTMTRNDAGTVTVTAADNNAVADLTILPGGAAAMTIGGASTTALTVTTDSTGTAEVVLPTDAISAGEITNVERSIPLPLGSWVPCAGTVPGVWDASGADTEPDLVASPAGHLVIVFDDTGGSVDADTICNTFTVPADWASGGALRARVTQDGATAEIETFSCTASLDGDTASAANAGSNASQTAVQTVTSTPAITWAAGKAIQVACTQGNASADDTVNIHSIEAFYTATQ
jgi:hypothetical protein